MRAKILVCISVNLLKIFTTRQNIDLQYFLDTNSKLEKITQGNVQCLTP